MHAVLLGALNDRLLLVNPTDINPRQKKGVEIRSCLIGLLEPLLIGFATMQQYFEQKLDLSEVLYQITSRYFSCPICFISFPYASCCSVQCTQVQSSTQSQFRVSDFVFYKEDLVIDTLNNLVAIIKALYTVSRQQNMIFSISVHYSISTSLHILSFICICQCCCCIRSSSK